MISKLNNYSIYRKWVCSHLDYQFNVWVVFQAKMPNVCCFQLVKCKDLLIFSVLHHCKLKIFRIWTVVQTKKSYLNMSRFALFCSWFLHKMIDHLLRKIICILINNVKILEGWYRHLNIIFFVLNIKQILRKLLVDYHKILIFFFLLAAKINKES